jgi:hypothetical protein
MIHLDYLGIELQLKRNDDTVYVYDAVRKKWLTLTPEEHVRQMFLQLLLRKMNYPQSLIAVEKKIVVGKASKRFDAIVYNRKHEPWMLIECKEPETAISQQTFFQLLNYQQTINARYWLLTNGHQTFCADAQDINKLVWMRSLPYYCFTE